jgi:octopine/nopaline transport system ATP-binding protein
MTKGPLATTDFTGTKAGRPGAGYPVATALKIHSLRKRFGQTWVLNGIDLKVPEGEVISLIGSSGSGKSTMLRCINFLEMPTSGTIEVLNDGVSVERDAKDVPIITNKVDVQRIRTEVGMVFQSFNLWPHRTALENVTEALIWVRKMSRQDAVDRAMAVLGKVGMAAKHADYPQRLSGGQQQRVAIARVLAMQPKIMLFDEPASALDPELVGEVLKVIRSLAEEGNTILLVTHEMHFARDVSSRVLFLHNGLVEEDGAPEAIFNNPKSEKLRRFLSRPQ